MNDLIFLEQLRANQSSDSVAIAARRAADEIERLLAIKAKREDSIGEKIGEIARLTDAIWEYGEHRKSCRIVAGKECDCGFFDILKTLKETI